MHKTDLVAAHKRCLVLDTSVLVFHGDCFDYFEDSNIYITMGVLEELDNHKTRQDSVGVNARIVNRYLDALRKNGNLFSGVETPSGAKIFAMQSNYSLLPSDMAVNVDNGILAAALELRSRGEDVAVLSRDIALRVKCDSLNISADTYEKKTKRDGVYTGTITLEVSPEVIEAFYAEGKAYIPEEFRSGPLFVNECVLLKSGKTSALAIATLEDEVSRLKYSGGKGFVVQGISPRSKEQIFALEMLLDPEIHLVTLTGPAGVGKTLLACTAAIDHLMKKTYDKIIISRPVQSTSKDIGFLPGTKEEKLAPWLGPFMDNLQQVIGDEKHLKAMLERKQIEMEAITYIRGRSLPKTLFIIDESQNITQHEAKAIITRMGEGSKIVLLGDLMQIDSNQVNESTSGLSHVIELFKEFELAGHLTLVKGERSQLATFASEVM